MAVHTKPSAVHDDLWARIDRIFTHWTDVLGMNWMHLVLYRSDTSHETDSDCAADTSAKWQYRSAKITVYLPTVANHTDEDLEGIIVHELVHVLINPMESLMKDRDTNQCELAVENVALALMAAHGKYDTIDRSVRT